MFLLRTNNRLLAALLPAAMLIACSNLSEPGQLKTAAEKKADEARKRNPVKKGRYVCWRLSVGGDSVGPELYMLSDNMYQVDNVPGTYTYNKQTNTINFVDGPLHHVPEKWIGAYTPKGRATANGGRTLETMIRIGPQSNGDSNSKVVLQCNYAEVE